MTLGPNVPHFSPNWQSFFRGGYRKIITGLVPVFLLHKAPSLIELLLGSDGSFDLVHEGQYLVPPFIGIALALSLSFWPPASAAQCRGHQRLRPDGVECRGKLFGLHDQLRSRKAIVSFDGQSRSSQSAAQLIDNTYSLPCMATL